MRHAGKTATRRANRSIRTCAALAVTLLAATQASPARAQSLKGINLAGAEFNSSKIPGRYGYDYIYPKVSEPPYYASTGMTVIRQPVLWERLQPSASGDLSPDELARLDTAIAVNRAAGLSTIIDIHNYGHFQGQLLDAGNATSADFADLWRRIATHYARQNDVLFGLMNEPQETDAAAWAATEQQAVDAIRKTDATNTILISGIGWDGAWTFIQKNADALASVNDPLGKTLIELHQYFDTDGSGTHSTCVAADSAVQRLTPATQWAIANGRKLFLGEFGVPNDSQCLADLDAVLGYIDQNASAWAGWTYWAAGPIWGHYALSAEPNSGQDSPQMTIMKTHLASPTATTQNRATQSAKQAAH